MSDFAVTFAAIPPCVCLFSAHSKSDQIPDLGSDSFPAMPCPNSQADSYHLVSCCIMDLALAIAK